MARRGPAPSSRRTLSDAFVAAVRSSPHPLYVLGQRAGWPSGREVCYLTLPGAVVSETQLTVARLQCLAAILGFPAADVFAPVNEDGASAVVRQ